jgi:hypothetical protein
MTFAPDRPTTGLIPVSQRFVANNQKTIAMLATTEIPVSTVNRGPLASASNPVVL